MPLRESLRGRRRSARSGACADRGRRWCGAHRGQPHSRAGKYRASLDQSLRPAPFSRAPRPPSVSRGAQTKGADMNSRIKQLAFVLLLVSVVLVSATPTGAAPRGHAVETPLAGPWYTPQELKALSAYSNASFAQKKALLTGSNPAPITAGSGPVALAGPR